MKVLILSSNNGGGHNAVAQALQEYYEARGDICVIRDCLSFLSARASRLVSHTHSFVYRHTPRLFGAAYRMTEQRNNAFCENRRERRLMDKGRLALGIYIQQEGFEQVLCTHVFAAMMLTSAKREYDLSIKTAIIETDYTNTPGSAENDVEFHFIPDRSLIPELVQAGVDRSKIVVSGIPVRQEMFDPCDKKLAKTYQGIAPDLPHVLVMGGSMGCGPIPDIVTSLYLSLGENTIISVVCGENERLKKSLVEDFGHLKTIRILGYVQGMSSLYDSADLLLTKPGGITVTEAAVKGLPMVLIDSVSGCEAHNLQHFVTQGAAVACQNINNLGPLCCALLLDTSTLARMQRSLLEYASLRASEIIYATMKEDGRSASCLQEPETGI